MGMLWSVLGFLLFLPVYALAQDAPAVPAGWFDVGDKESAIVLKFYQEISPQLLEIYGESSNPYQYIWETNVPFLTQFRVPPGAYQVNLPLGGGSISVDAQAGKVFLLDFTAFNQNKTETSFETFSPENLRELMGTAGLSGFAIDPSISYISPEASVIDIRSRMPPGVKPPPRPDPPPG